MGRVVETLVADIVTYIPDLPGNRTDPEPFSVELKPLTGREFETYERMIGKARRGDRDSGNIMARIQSQREALFRDHVISVEGYTVKKKDSTVLNPKNGLELLQALRFVDPDEMNLVVLEVEEALMSNSKLKEGMLGK